MYVVMGATGNTGGVVARLLLAAGKKVRGIGRTEQRLQFLAQKGGEPFVCDVKNREALTKAFTGAEAVYVMIPPEQSARDYHAHQQAVTDAVAAALERSKVKFAVTLSSVGADKAQNTGPVVGLHQLEQRLNGITGLNLLHLRAGYFMENTLPQVEMIRAQGICAGPLSPQLKVPMINTGDIGAAAAQALLKFDFGPPETRELLGARDFSMNEAATIIGNAIGTPHLKYVQAPEDQIRGGMQQMGMSPDLVGQILEMASALNSGHMKALEPRSARNTTSTSYESFVQQEFLPRFNATPKAA
jgi:uncharacterized protein YbjT (DUF2867 family)